jgi:hypothetical protein
VVCRATCRDLCSVQPLVDPAFKPLPNCQPFPPGCVDDLYLMSAGTALIVHGPNGYFLSTFPLSPPATTGFRAARACALFIARAAGSRQPARCGCATKAAAAELLPGIDGVSSRLVRKIVPLGD